MSEWEASVQQVWMVSILGTEEWC